MQADNKFISLQKDYISLLLKQDLAAEKWMSSTFTKDHFDAQFKIILSAVQDAYENASLLTRSYFENYINNYLSKKQDKIGQINLFNSIYIRSRDIKDIVAIERELHDIYLINSTNSLLKKLPEMQEKVGRRAAIAQVADNLKSLSEDVDIKPITYVSGYDYALEFYKGLTNYDVSADEEIVKCHIREIDETSVIGFAPGTLSLFCADVGTFKTTIMMNVGVNLWKKSNKNVLFVPIEMPLKPYEQKLISCAAGIPFEKLIRPGLLEKGDLDFIKKEIDSWKDIEGKHYLMESLEDRVKVSTIRREIKKHIEIFEPDIIVVDYVANLVPDAVRNGRNDLEIGDMLKDLQHMGKPGVVSEKGFAIVSAAQVGRDALKRAIKDKDNISFTSSDIRGSHEYAMYATNIYVQWKDSDLPNEKLWIAPIKCRYGKTSYSDGTNKSALDIKPEINRISSFNIDWTANSSEQILEKVNSDDDDLFSDANDIDVNKNSYNGSKAINTTNVDINDLDF